MKQLNVAATFVAATVLTVFALTCWLFEGRPFHSPAAAVEAPAVVNESEEFGGRFGIRGPSQDWQDQLVLEFGAAGRPMSETVAR